MIDDRDERLGHELRSLDVPDHGPGFYARLSERISEDPPGATVHRLRRPRPAILMTMAIAAVILALVGVSTQFAGKDGPPPEPHLITAAEVRDRVSVALASLRSLSGEITMDCPEKCMFFEGPTARWSFVTTAAGDERITGIGGLYDYAYSTARRELRWLTAAQMTVTSNVAAGPPDFIARSLLNRDIVSVLQAFPGTVQEVTVAEVVEQGRPAFRMVTPLPPSTTGGANQSDRTEVVIDRATGFPLRKTQWLGSKLLGEVRLSNLVVNGPVDPAVFTFEPPAGARVYAPDAGFQRVTLGELEALVGYQPVLPALAGLPSGYVLADVTVRTAINPFDKQARNAGAPVLVSVAYRRGFDRITVTTSASGSARRCVPGGHINCWVDPLASGVGYTDEPERFTVASGALAGAEGELVISARGVPHVWTVDDRLIVTVAGDANGDELKRIAGSFASDRPGPATSVAPPTSSPPTSTGDPTGCTNLALTDAVRAALITANGQPGGLLSIAYYGSCGTTSYAMARFRATPDATFQQKVNFQGEGQAPKFLIQEGGTWRLVGRLDFMLPQSCASFAELPAALKSLWQNCPAQTGPGQPAPPYAQS